MPSGNSFEWPDLSKPFWPFRVFAGLLFFVSLCSAWPWLRSKRAARWPVTQGRIESVDVTEGRPSWYSTEGGSPAIAELGYSYSIAGTVDTGRYRRDFPTQQEAREFVRELKGKSVEIHYYPRNTRLSQLSEPGLAALLRNRSAVLDSESEYVVPKWIHPFLWVFLCISAVGLILSLWVHLGALMGHIVAPPAFFFILGVGVFLVWLPALFAGIKLAANVDRKYYWKAATKGAPRWMRSVVAGFFAYAVINFMIFIAMAPHGGRGPELPAIFWRGFSGHWMAFCSAALVTLYSAVHVRRLGWRCAKGHFVALGARWCERCGQPNRGG